MSRAANIAKRFACMVVSPSNGLPSDPVSAWSPHHAMERQHAHDPKWVIFRPRGRSGWLGYSTGLGGKWTALPGFVSYGRLKTEILEPPPAIDGRPLCRIARYIPRDSGLGGVPEPAGSEGSSAIEIQLRVV